MLWAVLASPPMSKARRSFGRFQSPDTVAAPALHPFLRSGWPACAVGLHLYRLGTTATGSRRAKSMDMPSLRTLRHTSRVFLPKIQLEDVHGT